MIKKIAYSILSGVLFSLAWTEWHLAWALFIAFVPLLFIEDDFSRRANRNSRAVFLYAYLSFFTWNLISTWWISNSTIFGGVTAVVLNALWYAVLFWIFHLIKRRMGKYIGYSALIFLWLAFENIYINGEISWVWLLLGNGFANNTELIQWYEYTGVLGGSLWVLIVNVLFYNLILNVIKYKTLPQIFNLVLLFVLVVPILLSITILKTYKESINPIDVSLVQPNIDPYTDKFSGMSQTEQLNQMLSLIQEKGNPEADFFVLPETAIDGVWENNIEEWNPIIKIQQFMSDYPQSSMVLGATTRYLYLDESSTPTSRVYPPEPNLQYDIFNSALQINHSDSLQKYHKSMLVIGTEMTPYPAFFDLFKDYIIDLGGTTGNLGTQDYRSVFHNSNNQAILAPVVCYESIYGEFVTEYIREGANVIFIITNDAWWGDTPGYHQHLSFAKLRAIENRRSIARCANTGISAIINQKGEIETHTQYWEKVVLNGSLNLNSKQTFFSKNGDWIGEISKFIALLILLSVVVDFIRKR